MKALGFGYIIAWLASAAWATSPINLNGADKPACAANTDEMTYIIADPLTDADCTTGGGSANPHLCVCDGTVWRPDYPDNHELITVNDSATAPVIAVDASNRVGVRTATPGDNLHVYSAVDGSVFVRIESGATPAAAGISCINTSRRYDLGIGTADDFALFDSTASTFPIVIAPGAPTDAFYMASDGDIGIGTSTPDFELDVEDASATVNVIFQGATSASVLMKDGDATADERVSQILNSASLLRLRGLTDVLGSGVTGISLELDTGDVGINTTAPAEALDVAGSINSREHITSSTTSPSVGTCGTSPAISGTDIAGLVTFGTAGPTSCVVTFATAYAAAPHCVISPTSTLATAEAVVTTTTTLTIGDGTTDLSSVAFHYICVE